MRGMFIVILIAVAGMLIAAEAPKTPAADAKKAPVTETKKAEPVAAKGSAVASPAAEAKKVEPAPVAAPAKEAKAEPKPAALPEPKVYEIKDETVTDTKTGLMWQRKQADKSMTHKEAVDYCEALTIAGHDDWRLPAVTELRTLIVGCQSATDACKIGEKCLYSKCWSPACSCQANKGPGEDGFYWQKGVWQGIGKYFWSSSVQAGKKADKAWDVGFNYGNVYDFDRTQKADVRCVRGGAAVAAPAPATPAATTAPAK